MIWEDDKKSSIFTEFNLSDILTGFEINFSLAYGRQFLIIFIAFRIDLFRPRRKTS